MQDAQASGRCRSIEATEDAIDWASDLVSVISAWEVGAHNVMRVHLDDCVRDW
jgi:hypothetical protein